jgi:hypothetical protein
MIDVIASNSYTFNQQHLHLSKQIIKLAFHSSIRQFYSINYFPDYLLFIYQIEKTHRFYQKLNRNKKIKP